MQNTFVVLQLQSNYLTLSFVYDTLFERIKTNFVLFLSDRRQVDNDKTQKLYADMLLLYRICLVMVSTKNVVYMARKSWAALFARGGIEPVSIDKHNTTIIWSVFNANTEINLTCFRIFDQNTSMKARYKECSAFNSVSSVKTASVLRGRRLPGIINKAPSPNNTWLPQTTSTN